MQSVMEFRTAKMKPERKTADRHRQLLSRSVGRPVGRLASKPSGRPVGRPRKIQEEGKRTRTTVKCNWSKKTQAYVKLVTGGQGAPCKMWSTIEKKLLLDGLKQYSHQDWDSLCKMVPTRTKEEIQEYMHELKGGDHYRRPENARIELTWAPIESWLDLSAEMVHYEQLDLSNVLSRVFSIIGHFSSFPKCTSPGQDPDYGKLYRFIAAIMDETLAMPDLTHLESAIIADLLHGLGDMLRISDTSLQRKVMCWKYKMLNYKFDFNDTKGSLDRIRKALTNDFSDLQRDNKRIVTGLSSFSASSSSSIVGTKDKTAVSPENHQEMSAAASSVSSSTNSLTTLSPVVQQTQTTKDSVTTLTTAEHAACQKPADQISDLGSIQHRANADENSDSNQEPSPPKRRRGRQRIHEWRRPIEKPRLFSMNPFCVPIRLLRLKSLLTSNPVARDSDRSGIQQSVSESSSQPNTSYENGTQRQCNLPKKLLLTASQELESNSIRQVAGIYKAREPFSRKKDSEKKSVLPSKSQASTATLNDVKAMLKLKEQKTSAQSVKEFNDGKCLFTTPVTETQGQTAPDTNSSGGQSSVKVMRSDVTKGSASQAFRCVTLPDGAVVLIPIPVPELPPNSNLTSSQNMIQTASLCSGKELSLCRSPLRAPVVGCAVAVGTSDDDILNRQKVIADLTSNPSKVRQASGKTLTNLSAKLSSREKHLQSMPVNTERSFLSDQISMSVSNNPRDADSAGSQQETEPLPPSGYLVLANSRAAFAQEDLCKGTGKDLTITSSSKLAAQEVTDQISEFSYRSPVTTELKCKQPEQPGITSKVICEPQHLEATSHTARFSGQTATQLRNQSTVHQQTRKEQSHLIGTTITLENKQRKTQPQDRKRLTSTKKVTESQLQNFSKNRKVNVRQSLTKNSTSASDGFVQSEIFDHLRQLQSKEDNKATETVFQTISRAVPKKYVRRTKERSRAPCQQTTIVLCSPSGQTIITSSTSKILPADWLKKKKTKIGKKKKTKKGNNKGTRTTSVGQKTPQMTKAPERARLIIPTSISQGTHQATTEIQKTPGNVREKTTSSDNTDKRTPVSVKKAAKDSSSINMDQKTLHPIKSSLRRFLQASTDQNASSSQAISNSENVISVPNQNRGKKSSFKAILAQVASPHTDAIKQKTVINGQSSPAAEQTSTSPTQSASPSPPRKLKLAKKFCAKKVSVEIDATVQGKAKRKVGRPKTRMNTDDYIKAKKRPANFLDNADISNVQVEYVTVDAAVKRMKTLVESSGKAFDNKRGKKMNVGSNPLKMRLDHHEVSLVSI